MEAVQEFNLLRDSYGAEYGKRPGAQVAIVTRGGTNQLHGSLADEFFCATTRWTRATFSTAWEFQGARFSAESVRNGSLRRPDPEGQDLLFCSITKGSASTYTKPAWIWFPTTTCAAGSSPCALLDSLLPCLNPCPASGVAQFVGVSPLINLWPVASPRRSPDFGGVAEAFQHSAADDSRRPFRDRSAWITYFRRKTPLSAVYTIDDSSNYTPTNFNSYTADTTTLREQVLSHKPGRSTHIFFADLA